MIEERPFLMTLRGVDRNKLSKTNKKDYNSADVDKYLSLRLATGGASDFKAPDTGLADKLGLVLDTMRVEDFKVRRETSRRRRAVPPPPPHPT